MLHHRRYNFHSLLIVKTTFPLTAMVFLYAVSKIAHRCKVEVLKRVASWAEEIAFFILFLAFPSASFTIFSAFPCITLDDDSRVLRADVSIDCDGPDHQGMLVYAYLMIFLWPIATPCIYAYLLLWKHRDGLKLIQEDQAAQVASLRMQRKGKKFEDHAHKVCHHRRHSSKPSSPSSSAKAPSFDVQSQSSASEPPPSPPPTPPPYEPALHGSSTPSPSDRTSMGVQKKPPLLQKTTSGLSMRPTVLNRAKTSMGSLRNLFSSGDNSAAATLLQQVEDTKKDIPPYVLQLTAGYEMRTYWFEILETLRKLLLIGMPVFFESGSFGQLVFGLCTSFISSMLYTNLSPYEDHADDRLSQICQAEIFFSLVCSIALRGDSSLSRGASDAGVLDAFLTILGAAPVFLGILYTLASEETLLECFISLVGNCIPPCQKASSAVLPSSRSSRSKIDPSVEMADCSAGIGAPAHPSSAPQSSGFIRPNALDRARAARADASKQETVSHPSKAISKHQQRLLDKVQKEYERRNKAGPSAMPPQPKSRRQQKMVEELDRQYSERKKMCDSKGGTSSDSIRSERSPSHQLASDRL